MRGIELDSISCHLSPKETVHIKCQPLLSGRNRKKKTKKKKGDIKQIKMNVAIEVTNFY